MKISKLQIFGLGNISFSGNLPFGGFVVLKGPNFGGPMDQIWWSYGPNLVVPWTKVL